MKASLLAVALLATIAISSAVDEECVQRKLRGLAVHWPNPADCFSFYRCTNKDVKRSLLCPAGKEYNPKTGRCANLGKNLCKLSLTAPLADATNPCANEISGTFVALEGSCRSFNICNDNMAYPQNCDAGSLFNTTIAACQPDPEILCWENLCLSKDNGVMVANANDCFSFYVCNEQIALAQACPAGSYFDKNALNCQPGDCPTEADLYCDSSKCVNADDYTVFPALNTLTGFCTCINQKPEYNECPIDSIFVASLAVCVAQDKVCPSSNCLNKPDYTNFPAVNTTMGYCTCLNNEASYNTCADDSVFVGDLAVCVAQDKVCPSSNCLNKPDYTNFPAANTTTGYCTCLNNEASYNTCADDSVFVESLAVCVAQDKVCPSSNCLNKPDYTNFPAVNTTSGYCTCLNNEASYNACADDSVFVGDLAVCVAQDKVCPSSNCLNKPDYTNFPAANTTTGYCTCLNNEASYNTCADDSIFDESVSICVAQDNVCPSSNCLNKPDYTNFPAANTTTGFCTCLNNEATYHECPDDSIFDESVSICVAQDKVCPSSNCLNKPDYTNFPAANTTTGFCTCVNNEATYHECPDDSIFDESVSVCVAQEKVCPSSNCLNIPDCTNFPAANTTTGYCKCVNNEATYYDCPADSIFDVTAAVCVAQNTVCPSSNCLNKPDYTNFPAANTTTGFCTCLNNEATYHECPDDSIFDESVSICVAQDKVCPSSNCLNIPDCTNFPAANTTTGYCKCVNNEATYHDCPEDSIFEATSAVCVAQNTVCPSINCLNKPDYTNFPAANTTTGYCTCLNNEATYYDCADSGFTYDTELGFCVKLPADDCEEETPSPLLCEGGFSEGDFVPNVDNCMLFFICFEGELVESTCGTGNYYDDDEKVCLPDTEGKCPACTEAAQQATHERNKRSIKAVNCVEGDMTPHPSDSQKFFICDFGGEQVLQDCGEGNYYNPISEICETKMTLYDDTVSTCPGGYLDCEVWPNPTDCDKYYKCNNGIQESVSCGTDNYFNEDTLSCEKDVNNVCSTKTDCTCAGGYIEGQLSAHPTDCDKYYICHGGTQVLNACGTDNYFNAEILSCEKDVNNECSTKTDCTCPGGYIEGQLSAHPTDCDKYYICHGGTQVLGECGTDNYFNEETLACEKDVNNVCFTKTNCTCPGGYIEGEMSAHPTECFMYYICSDSKQVLMDCGTNNYFTGDGCALDTEYKCRPNVCTDQDNGQFVANAQQCNAYFLCENQKPTPEVCEDGEWFDNVKLSCQPDIDAVCYNPCANDQTINLLPHPDPTKYYFCNGPQTIVGTCVNGIFNATLGICQSQTVVNPCDGQSENYAFVDPDDNTQFYVCLSGVPILYSCEPNTSFDSDVRICLPTSDPDCDPTPCNSNVYVPPYPTLNDNEDNAFCLCRGLISLKNYCESGMVFNNDVGVCFSNAPCDPTICRQSAEYTVSPNRNDTNSFCLCVNESPVIVDCPDSGSFNPFTLTCSNVEISSQCDQFECIGNADYHIFSSSVATDNGFCMCRDQIATFIPCGEDSKFNDELNICQLDNIHCNPKECVGLPNNSKIPALTTTNGYCECNGGNAAFNECPLNGEFNATTEVCIEPACAPDLCDKADDYTNFPASNTITGFCLCVNNSPQYRDCPEDQEFDVNVGVCIRSLPACDDSMCIDLPEFSAVPSWNSPQGFCLCSGGKATLESCPPNNVFNAATGLCNLDTEGLCGSTTYCENCLLANDCSLYPAINNVNGFCLCDGATVPNFRECPVGSAFDSNSLICRTTPESNCDASLCAGATIENPISSPALSGKTSFCYCPGPDDIMLLTCPDGKYYNDDVKLCVNLMEERFSCPNGMLNGAIVGEDNMCNKYFVCLDGVMHENTCAAGEYFDVATSRCSKDTKGVCVTQTAFTCLGAYHEGELIEHPVNKQMYYVCRNYKLHERNCGKGRIFFKDMNQCSTIPRVNNRFPQKRSVDENENEYFCSENEKRSVPSNCSQYEICLDQLWKRRTCSNFRYYNPEQQKCLEPRDDLVCMYAKVTTLPTCNNTIEFKLMKAKTCQQYYRCQKEQWRLKSCGKQQYFNSQIGACVSMPLNDANFQCETKESEESSKNYLLEDKSCQHLSIRYYEGNCAMYLMCLDNDWWYQFCPVGMYFNRSFNYCIPDLDQQCSNSVKAKEIVATEEFANETCLQDGALRPSALACNRYFICFKAKWQMQHCNKKEFYDVSNAKCSLDLEGVCLQLSTDCMAGEKRIYNLNCAAYEQCSVEGKWLQRECPMGQMYDDLLKDCVINDGICSKHGFKRVCSSKETMAVSQNCSMFYYCSQSTWQLGNCLKGFMYSSDFKTCLPYSSEDMCKPLVLEVSTHLQVYTSTVADLCKGQLDGTSVAHPEDCTRFYICIQEMNSHEMQCSKGSYFEASMGYCRPNDGACRLPLTGVCENATDGASVAHPTDCQSYYKCSTINGTELFQCPEGQYYHKYIRQCRIDHGECKKDMAQKCIGLEHGTKLAHDSYCNIYYACVKGLAIPVECPDNHQFNPILGICVYDEEQQCQNGQLIDGNLTYSCGNLADGSYIPDRQDCTRYYICTNGQALHKKCSGSTYFDSQLLLCIPDDGSCPYVDEDVEQNNPVAPDPIVCESKHGYLMLDPFNCNNFYACVHNKLKHERCYTNQFFNATWLQCQAKPSMETNATELLASGATRVLSQQCTDDVFSVDKLCSELAEGNSIAEQNDCRRYITCQEAGEEPLSQRCRNGESFDSLLGFCRQNDGTCSLDNGQRVGECSGKHGQLARDVSNCRGYFVCINGQKIAQTCQDDEYFSKSQNICLKDTQQICGAAQQPEEVTKQSCTGLSESILYPYIYDNCRSYFQCFNGEAKIHKCADDLYFDPATIKCVKGKTECLMPAQSLQRSPESAQTFSKLCSNKDFNTPYANLENNCRSFYFCHNNGKVSHQLCPLGKKFDKDLNVCMPESLVICKK